MKKIEENMSHSPLLNLKINLKNEIKMKSQATLNHQRTELKRHLAENAFAAALCVFTSLVLFAVAVTTYSEARPQIAVICGVGCVALLVIMVWFITKAVDCASKLDSREFNRR